MILITTLMLIAVLALLIVSQLQLFLLDYKSLNRFRGKQKSFWALEHAANKLISQNEGLMKRVCLLNETDPNDAIELLNNKKGCVLNIENQNFYYFIEDLGFFPCLPVSVDNVLYSTHHFRISLSSSDQEAVILQLRFAKLAKFAQCENQSIGRGTVGLLSWRYTSHQSPRLGSQLN